MDTTKIMLLAPLVGLLVRALKSDSVPPPLSRIPKEARPTIAIVLGCGLSAIEGVATGKTWQMALAEGATAAAVAMVGHYLGIEVLRGGQEIPLWPAKPSTTDEPPPARGQQKKNRTEQPEPPAAIAATEQPGPPDARYEPRTNTNTTTGPAPATDSTEITWPRRKDDLQ